MISNINLVTKFLKYNNYEYRYQEILFNDPTTSVSVLDIRSNDVTFDKCQFLQCGPNAISLCKGGENKETLGTFVFTNNYVKNNRGRFINGYNMQSKPVIQGNIFEEMTITENSFILISHNQDEIELVDNTFSKFTVSGNNELNGGGIASIFDKSNAEFTLKYTNCRFYDNNNKHNKSPTSQGGSLQIGFSSANINININVNIENCEFKRNKAIKHGGGISIRSAKSIVIRGSEFESNVANNEAISSRLLFDNHYEDKTHGFGGAIYLNPTFKLNDQDYNSISITIDGCTFKNNRAYEGYAIYIEGEESSTTYSITNNKFINNYEGLHCPTNGGVIASEVFAITNETIESSNQFSTEEGYESRPLIHLDHKGVRLPYEFSYDDKNPTDPGKGRIEREMNPNNDNEKNAKVVVTVSEFNKNTNDDEGAIHLINCGLECTKTKFIECASENGGGGGIYIKNTEDSLNDVNNDRLEFNKCRAQYGGGIYIYSKYETNKVLIKDCSFIKNQATLESSSNDLFGGSAIYLRSEKGIVNNCRFKANKGRGGALKVINDYQSDALLMNKKKIIGTKTLNSLVISNCNFEISKDSMSSIVYENGRKIDLIVNNCVFTGKLIKDAHHIEGNIIVKSCKFSCSPSEAFKFDPNNKNFSIDLNNQIFNYVEKSGVNDWKIILSFALPAAGIALVGVVTIIVIVIIINKKHSYSDDQNEDDQSNDTTNSI